MITSNRSDVPEEQRWFAAVSRFRCCGVLSAKSRTALPVGGTGTALEHEGQLFVLTCDHVVDGFLNDGVGWVNFFNPPTQIDRRRWDVVDRDPKLDVAVLKLKRGIPAQQTNLCPLVLGNLGSRSHYFRAKPATKWNYVVTGLPGAIWQLDTSTHRIEVNPLTFASGVIARRGNTLILDYRHGKLGGSTLSPCGMSGGLVFEMHAPVDGEIWTPGLAVAMQRAWDTVSRLMCSPVHQLRKVILSAV